MLLIQCGTAKSRHSASGAHYAVPGPRSKSFPIERVFSSWTRRGARTHVRTHASTREAFVIVREVWNSWVKRKGEFIIEERRKQCRKEIRKEERERERKTCRTIACDRYTVSEWCCFRLDSDRACSPPICVASQLVTKPLPLGLTSDVVTGAVIFVLFPPFFSPVWSVLAVFSVGIDVVAFPRSIAIYRSVVWITRWSTYRALATRRYVKEDVAWAVCERHAGYGNAVAVKASQRWREGYLLPSERIRIGGWCCLTIGCYDRAADSSRGTIMIYLRLHVGRSLRCNTNARYWNVFIVPLFPLWIIGAFCVKDSEYRQIFLLVPTFIIVVVRCDNDSWKQPMFTNRFRSARVVFLYRRLFEKSNWSTLFNSETQKKYSWN